MEQAIFAQFELLAQQKQFILPSIQFIDYQWDPTRKLKRVQRLQLKGESYDYCKKTFAN